MTSSPLRSISFPKIFLASKSPRRHALLKIITSNFEVVPLEVDESFDSELPPQEVVQMLSKRKAIAAAASLKLSTEWILSADTIVVLGAEILNKPSTVEEAKAMLTKLSGNHHLVFTGFTLLKSEQGELVLHTAYESTEVYFKPLSVQEIEDYIRYAKPFDKAGSYGIQDDFGACFIPKINGCYYNVVGLPISRLYREMNVFFQMPVRVSKEKR
ncbi:MAG: Maf family protein [Chloroherpetonaceae bacterium]|nr:Maf family protein [Chloroherpetonaceae bacterium]